MLDMATGVHNAQAEWCRKATCANVLVLCPHLREKDSMGSQNPPESPPTHQKLVIGQMKGTFGGSVYDTWMFETGTLD